MGSELLEWTGVPLRTLLGASGPETERCLDCCGGSDAGRMARSIPLEKVLDDVLVAYGQNGEALRPSKDIPCGSSFQAGRATRI